jgi:hypothetical protein
MANRRLAIAVSKLAGEVDMKPYTAAEAAEEVARALVSTRSSEGTAFITTPVTYPSGAHSLVHIDGMNNRWFVSDDGYGAQEADLMGASTTFKRVARMVADRAGIGFDQKFLFVVEATRDELAGAVVAVANASAEAVRRTAMRVEELRYAASRALFDERIETTFRGSTIVRQPEILGASGRSWEFSAGIEREGNIIYLLDLVRPRPSAVYATISKFTDMQPVQQGRKGAAILTDYERTDPHLISLLSRVVGVALPAGAPETVWREQLATAA